MPSLLPIMRELNDEFPRTTNGASPPGRRQRLAKALRENLRRRKAQERSRSRVEDSCVEPNDGAAAEATASRLSNKPSA